MIKTKEETIQQGNTYISGGQGDGKISLMIDMMMKKQENKEGFICIDTNGEVSDYLLQYIAENVKQNKSLVDDILYIDFGNKEYIHTLNIFDVDNLENSIQHILDLFFDMYGPKTFNLNVREYLFNLFMVLAEDPKTLNFINVLKIFQDKNSMSKIKNQLIWDRFYNIKNPNNNITDTIQTILAPLMQGQLGRILNIRNSSNNKCITDLKDMIKNNKIIIFRLPEEELGFTPMLLLYRILLGHINYILSNNRNIVGDKGYSLFLPDGQYGISDTLLKVLNLNNKTNFQVVFGHNNTQQFNIKKRFGSSTEILEDITNYFDKHILFKQTFINEKIYLDSIYGKNLYSGLSGDDNLINLGDMEYVLYDGKTNNSQKLYIERHSNIISDKNKHKIQIVKDMNKLCFGTKRELVDKELAFISASVVM